MFQDDHGRTAVAHSLMEFYAATVMPAVGAAAPARKPRPARPAPIPRTCTRCGLTIEYVRV